MRKFGNYLRTIRGKITLLGWLILGFWLAAGSGLPVLAQFPLLPLPGTPGGIPIPPGFTKWLSDTWDKNDWGTGLVFSAMNIFTGTMLQMLMNIVRMILAPLIKSVLSISLGKPTLLLDEPVAISLWRYMLIVADSIYLIALVIASIAIIARLSVVAYNIKKVLGSFITAVILTNISFIIVRILLSVGNKLTDMVYSTINSTGLLLVDGKANTGFQIASTADLVSLLGNLLDDIRFPAVIGINSYAIAAKIFVFALTVIILWLTAKLALLFLERMIRLFIAAVTAPVIFAASMLPNFQKAASGWWDSTIKWIIVLPITVFVILVSLFFFKQAGITSPQDFTYASLIGKIDFAGLDEGLEDLSKDISINPETDNNLAQVFIAQTPPSNPTPSNAPLKDGKFTPYGYFWLGIALFALYSAGNVSNMLKLGSVMTGMVESPGKLFKSVQGLSRSAQKLTADTWGGKNLVGRASSGLYGTWAGGTEAGKRFEETRQGFTPVSGGGSRQWGRNLLAWGINYPGSMAAVKAQRKAEAEESQLRGITRQELDAKRILDNAADRHSPGKVWSDLTEAEKDSLERANPTVRAASARYGQYKKAGKYFTKMVAKRADIEDIDPDKVLEDLTGMQTGGPEDFDLGAIRAKIKQLQILAKSNRPMGKRAKEILEKGELAATLESLGQNRGMTTLSKDMGAKTVKLEGTATDEDYITKQADLTVKDGAIAAGKSGLSDNELQQFGLGTDATADKVAAIGTLWDPDIEKFIGNDNDGIKLRRAYQRLLDETSRRGDMTDDEKQTFIKDRMREEGYIDSSGKITTIGEGHAIAALGMAKDGIQIPELKLRMTLAQKAPGMNQTTLQKLITDIKDKIKLESEMNSMQAGFQQEQIDLGNIYGNVAESKGSVNIGSVTYDLKTIPDKTSLSNDIKVVYKSAAPGSAFDTARADQILSEALSRSTEDIGKMSQEDKLRHLRILGASLNKTTWADITGSTS